MEETQTIQISDADIQRIVEGVAPSVSGSSSVVLARLDGIDAQILAASEGMRESVAALAVSPDVSQTVSVSGSQWDFLHDSLAFHSAALVFTLSLVGVLVGMLFFREFARGVKRA